MEHRHLLPDEIDLLVDGEEGFGVAPLMAHVESCATCRGEVENRRKMMAELEHLPHLTPSPLFAYHVMRDVQVFEPWYVTASDTARRLMPRSGPERAIAGAAAGVGAVVVTLVTVWLASRLDAVLFLLGLATQRVRGAVWSTVSGSVSAAMGDDVARGMAGGGAVAVAVVASGFLFLVVVAAVSLRAVTSASRRRSS